MKFKIGILGLCLSLSASLFASAPHLHPKANQQDQQLKEKNLSQPGYCQIEIINNSFDDVRVYGVFDDGSSLYPFNVYSWGAPATIGLIYYGYCHSGMDLYINTFSGMLVYAGYTPVNMTIRLIPSFGKQVKAEISSK